MHLKCKSEAINVLGTKWLLFDLFFAGPSIALQRNLLDPQKQDMHPFGNFLMSVPAEMASKKLAFTSALSLSEFDIKCLKNNTLSTATRQTVVCEALGLWIHAHKATYKLLCHKLKSTSICNLDLLFSGYITI